MAIFGFARFLQESRLVASALRELGLIVWLGHHARMLAVYRVKLDVTFVLHRVQLQQSLMLLRGLYLSRLQLRALRLTFAEQVQFWPVERVAVFICSSFPLAQVAFVPAWEISISRVVAALGHLRNCCLDLNFI